MSLVEELYEDNPDKPSRQSKPAVVMVGRFQPPTIGHYEVIDKMKNFSRKNGSMKPIVVIVNNSNSNKDTSKNPLSGDDRQKFMMASGKANGVLFIQSESAFKAFEDVRRAGYEPIAIAAGSDRAKNYLKMLDKYFTNDDGTAIEHHIVPGLDERNDPDDEGTPSEEVLRIAEDGDDIPTHLISGSMARLAVQLKLKNAFSKIVGLPRNVSDLLFTKISKASASE